MTRILLVNGNTDNREWVRELDLSPVEFRLMAYFMENPGRVLARQHLLEHVWRRRNSYRFG